MMDNEITPTRYTYAKDVNDATASKIKKTAYTNMRLPLCTLEIATEKLSRDNDCAFHVVDAMKRKNSMGRQVIILRIITNTNRGVNVIIPCENNDILYDKYIDLRFLIRNKDSVYIEFPSIYVQGSKFRHELMLVAYDFRITNYM